MAIEKVFVVGAGLMGGGITQVAATAGFKVTMRDINDEAVNKGLDAIKWSVEKFASKGRITEEVAAKAIENITPTTSMDDAADADLVVEAVFENLELKQDVFKQLDKITSKETVLATNTSVLSITKVASVTERPEKVLGMHFFSPVPMMKLCEVVKGLMTSDETVAVATEFAEKIGKTPVVVQKDVAGFIANRVGLALSGTAISLVELGVATPEDIDKIMKLGFGHPMGPCETADMTGIDILHNAMKAIYDETKDPKYWPPELLQKMVTAGLLGRKTGKGFYDHSSGEQKSYWQL